MVDVETNGPVPGIYSMIEIGAVVVEPGLERTFHATLCPMTVNAVTGRTHRECFDYQSAKIVMTNFQIWLAQLNSKRLLFVSDNNGFDWQFINYYFHYHCSTNPFGFSSMNLGSFYKGLTQDTFTNFKHLRVTKHTHNALDDAIGNAEAMLRMKEIFPALKMTWK